MTPCAIEDTGEVRKLSCLANILIPAHCFLSTNRGHGEILPPSKPIMEYNSRLGYPTTVCTYHSEADIDSQPSRNGRDPTEVMQATD